jgi:drug/metabolite transporter (DMT)-like permease
MVFVSNRFLACTFFFLTIILIRTRAKFDEKKMNSKQMIILFCTGFLFAAGAYFYFVALKITDVASVVILNSSSALFVVAFARIFLGEKTGKMAIAMLLAVFVGCAIIFISPAENANSVKGNLCAVLCAVCYATYLVVMKKFSGLSVPPKLFITYMGSAIFALSVAIMQGGLFAAYAGKEYLYVLGSGLIAICIPESMMNYALRHVKAAFVGGANLMQPVISSFYAYLIWNEAPGISQLAGGILVLGGLFMYNRAETENRSIHGQNTWEQ